MAPGTEQVASTSRTLEIEFEAPDAFEREFTTNIANGGIFVETSESFSIREKVSVHVTLAYAGKSVQLDGEVVHIVSQAIASAGSRAGVAVHFDATAAALRELFGPLLASTYVEAAPPDHDDRRSAPRSRARVSARVRALGHEEVVGRTRDLSIAGVLVSIGGATPIETGEAVEVTITNPETGTEQTVLGKVRRHLAGDGDVVRAMGIQFTIPDSERSQVEKFLAELAGVEHVRHLGGIQGSIEELGLGNLVQTFGLAAREGTLDVMRGVEEGYVAFENGALRAASLGGTQGVKALARMLAWTDGTFEFHARVDPTLPTSDTKPLEAALLEATRLMDETDRVDLQTFPPDAILHVDELQRSAAGPLEKLEDALLDLASAGMNVQRVLDIVPEPDAQIYLALVSLVDRGILEVWRV
jgi:Tfp pilus assembly protein PilZ